MTHKCNGKLSMERGGGVDTEIKGIETKGGRKRGADERIFNIFIWIEKSEEKDLMTNRPLRVRTGGELEIRVCLKIELNNFHIDWWN